MNILYDIAFVVFLFFYLPVFLFRGKRRKGIFIRLGFYPKQLRMELKDKNNIWFHAVSVGEVLAAAPLIKALHEGYPGYRVVLSVVTETGYCAAKKILPDNDIALYLPFDLTFIVRKVIGYIRPVFLIITETELWPNLILSAHSMKIKVFLVNGRISDKSFRRYRAIKGLLFPVMECVDIFCMQTREYARRIESLGACRDRIAVLGNMKFDSACQGDVSDEYVKFLTNALCLEPGQRLIVAGSTHRGEEEMILGAYAQLKESHAGLRIIIAPRHIERYREIACLVRRSGLEPVFFSRLRDEALISPDQVVIVDIIGMLKAVYSIAYLVFVGGSLIKHGGQNMVEPAVFAKPIILGPHTFNFRDIVAMFLEQEAVMIAEDRACLKNIMSCLLRDKVMAETLGQKAALVVKSNTGAAQRILHIIENETVFL
ncbi:MAG: 3-deoxy-D-manno-octulosonic acid transferase [Candidatus Omnitrophota bacterium]|jgi:3-deoxy-D-manno-octulosonic-acid transferase